MRVLNVGISDKVLQPWMDTIGDEYLNCSDEGEAIGIAGGWWFATKERATVFMSADGFMNALNALTSWVIPEGIEMNIVISIGRNEPAHYVATEITEPIINMLKHYEPTKIHFDFVRKSYENIHQ